MDDWETRYIVRLYREGFSLRQIAEEIGRSHEWVRQRLIVARPCSPKLGRPPKYGERMLSFRFSLPPSLFRQIDRAARKKRISRNDVVVQVLMQGARRKAFL